VGGDEKEITTKSEEEPKNVLVCRDFCFLTMNV